MGNQEGEIFSGLSVIPGSQKAVKYLSENFDVYIATAAMEYPASCQYKFRWLVENFPFLNPSNFIFCGKKNILNVDFLVDDNARHFEGFCGQGILFFAAHNARTSWDFKVNSWDETVSVLETLVER